MQVDSSLRLTPRDVSRGSVAAVGIESEDRNTGKHERDERSRFFIISGI
jgi:hypothetical protein